MKRRTTIELRWILLALLLAGAVAAGFIFWIVNSFPKVTKPTDANRPQPVLTNPAGNLAPNMPVTGLPPDYDPNDPYKNAKPDTEAADGKPAAGEAQGDPDAPEGEPGVAAKNDIPAASDPEARDYMGARPSFDCKSARNEAERTICRDDELIQKDIVMAEIFAQAVQMSDNKPGLKQSQARWVREERDPCSGDVTCLFQAYQSRTMELGKMVGSSSSGLILDDESGAAKPNTAPDHQAAPATQALPMPESGSSVAAPYQPPAQRPAVQQPATQHPPAQQPAGQTGSLPPVHQSPPPAGLFAPQNGGR